MGKQQTVLQLLNLFNNRRVVSIQQIRTTCGLSRRSAYRYIQSLSESGIPVYFDRRSRGYRLAAPIQIRTDDFGITEALLLVAALDLMHGHVNDFYARQIRGLAERLVPRLPSESEVLHKLLLHEESYNARLPHPDYSSSIGNALTHLAVQLNREVVITVAGDGHTESQYVLKRPQLAFDGDWRVSDSSESPKSPISFPLHSVVHVRLVQPVEGRVH